MTRIFLSLIFLFSSIFAMAQIGRYGQIANENNTQRTQNNLHGANNDSTNQNKEIPKGIKEWIVDERFGDITPVVPDTISHLFPNSIFTAGLQGEYNTTGNLGAPRISRLFINRMRADQQFIFTQPYSFFIVTPGRYHFTNTLSPITNLTYNTAGNKANGEDHLTAKFAINAGKKIGVGFKFDYLYGRGFYANQPTSLFNYSMHGSYLGERYQAHMLFSTNHQKITENGGITDDEFITNPESFDDNYQASEIPAVLQQNWNRNNHLHAFITHRYSIGFNRKVPMTPEEIKAKKFAIEAKKQQEKEEEKQKAIKKAKKEGRKLNGRELEKQNIVIARPENAKIVGIEAKTIHTKDTTRTIVNGHAAADSLLAIDNKQKQDTAWTKNEYVPVTSFIHTFKFDKYERIYQAYQTPKNFYANNFRINSPFTGDSIYDDTKHFLLKNTFALSLLEGFNKWAKAGLKAFITHEMRHFELPDNMARCSYNENSIYVGGQLSKKQGKTLHYLINGEVGLLGKDIGKIDIDAQADLNFKLFGDTLQLVANGFFRHYAPTFYYQHYHAKHFWWDNNNLDNMTHTRIQGLLSYAKTHTTIGVTVDELTNYTYLAQTYNIGQQFQRTGVDVNVRQCSTPINVLTLSLAQNLAWGPLHLETVATFQNSSIQRALPLPKLNVYANLFLKFKIAKVLKTELGADVRYFTKYQAPDYSAALGQFVVQENKQPIELGNYPIVNVYANFHLQQTRFFVMYSHANEGSGTRNSFLVPHYPLNQRLLRFGLSWNFFN